jgi:hypothetical protein
MRFGDGTHDRQSEASASVSPGAAGIRAAEALERMRQEVGREAGTGVADLDDQVGAVGLPDDLDRRVRGASRSALSTRLSTASRIRCGST